jgi:hypothetical protein
MTREDTAATTLTVRTFHTLIAIAATFNLDIRQINALNVFINSEIDKEVYTWMADRFSESSYIYQLQRALYSLCRSPHLWQQELMQTLKELGLKQINTNTCLYTDNKVVIMVFIDDILILYRPEHHYYAANLIQQMQAKYEFRDLGKGGSFLNIKITRDRSKWKLWLSQ